MDVHTIGASLGIIGSLFYPLKWCYDFASNWLSMPVVKWGFIDCPNSTEAHYYIIVKARWSSKNKQDVTFILDVYKKALSDYELVVTDFYRKIGQEHHQETAFEQKKITESTMSKSYLLKIGVPYRVVVHVGVGEVGTLPLNQFDLQVYMSGVRLKVKHNRLPF
jgi:hypothetical protein